METTDSKFFQFNSPVLTLTICTPYIYIYIYTLSIDYERLDLWTCKCMVLRTRHGDSPPIIYLFHFKTMVINPFWSLFAVWTLSKKSSKIQVSPAFAVALLIWKIGWSVAATVNFYIGSCSTKMKNKVLARKDLGYLSSHGLSYAYMIIL